MAHTVGYAFEQFYEAINLGGDHRETANRRKNNVVNALSKAFTIVDAFSTGSIPKFTALKAQADADVMVVLNYTKHVKDKLPSEVLKSVREALSEWRTGARRNGQAVTLYYDTWPRVDIVPVSYTANSDGSVAHYNVPDSNTETWIKSRPKEHAAAIEEKSSECGINFRRIIKMIKHWNSVHSSYLQSYHIEVLALKVLSGDLSDLPWHIHKFFQDAGALLPSNLFYDTGYADSYLGLGDRMELIQRFDKAKQQSQLAWYYGLPDTGNDRVAIEKWGVIFGSKFPAYG